MNQKKLTVNSIFSFLPFFILFVWSFIFFAFITDYACFFQEKTSFFVFSRDYLADSLHQPGSLLIYFGNLITTFYYYPSAGAVIISIVICLSVFLISKIIRLLSDNKSLLIPVLYASVFFFLHTNYQYLLFNSLGILIQLIFFYLSIKYLKGFLPVIIFPFLYYFTGSFAFVFGLMYSLHIIFTSFKKGWIKIISIWIPIFLIIYIFKDYIIFRSFKTLIVYPISDIATGSQLKIFLPFSGLISLLPLSSIIKTKPSDKKKISGFLRNAAPSMILVIILATVSVIRSDKKDRQYFFIENLFYQQKYNEITEYLKKNPSTNSLTIFLNNIALCESGKLDDNLFNYRQSPDGRTLFLKWEMYGEILRRGGYFYYAIGMINEAQRWAYENMVNNGMTPEGLKMLIKTEIILGNYDMASKYNSLLMKTFFYRDEAKGFSRLMYNDKAVESNPELGTKRKEMIEHDFFVLTDEPYINIERILSFDSLNVKAYDYKLAYALLRKDYKGIISELPKLQSHGLNRIPVHIQEAALIYKVSNMGPFPQGIKLPFDQNIESRFGQFLQTLNSYGNNPKSAEPVLRKKFGDTFWYWAIYR